MASKGAIEAKQGIKPELESLVNGMKIKQQQQQQRQQHHEQQLPNEGATEEEAEQGVGTLRPKRYMAPQATPNMNLEAASAAAKIYKKKQKRIQKAVAKLEGRYDDAASKSCCVIL